MGCFFFFFLSKQFNTFNCDLKGTFETKLKLFACPFCTLLKHLVALHPCPSALLPQRGWQCVRCPPSLLCSGIHVPRSSRTGHPSPLMAMPSADAMTAPPAECDTSWPPSLRKPLREYALELPLCGIGAEKQRPHTRQALTTAPNLVCSALSPHTVWCAGGGHRSSLGATSRPLGLLTMSHGSVSESCPW